MELVVLSTRVGFIVFIKKKIRLADKWFFPAGGN
jgi:hypothetical protein